MFLIVAVLGLLVLCLLVGPGSNGATAATKSATKAPTTAAAPFSGKTGPAQVVASVTASAFPIANSLGATLGKPSCPPIEKPKVGLTLQCVIAFDKHPVGWLVSLRADGTLLARPTFPVVSKQAAEFVAGPGAVCALPSFAAVPEGANIDCTIDKKSIELVVGPNGSVSRAAIAST